MNDQFVVVSRESLMDCLKWNIQILPSWLETPFLGIFEVWVSSVEGESAEVRPTLDRFKRGSQANSTQLRLGEHNSIANKKLLLFFFSLHPFLTTMSEKVNLSLSIPT